MDGTHATDTLTSALAEIVGPQNVLTDSEDIAPYLVEWRNLYHGTTPAVVRPGNTEEVSQIMKWATRCRQPVVPQGGNTGLVGGQVPDESGNEVILSLTRLDKIRQVDAQGATVHVEAGAILQDIQSAAAEAGMLFPLTLGSQGTCRIGGNISTNAGGVGVLAYGNTRDLVLGLEVVLPTGEIWDGLSRLRKDNTGYDLKNLFIGGEGTLGIITAAILKLFPAPMGRAVAIAGIADPDAALTLLAKTRHAAGPGLTGFEIIPRIGLEFVIRHIPGNRDPMVNAHPWYAVVEIASFRSEEDAGAMMEAALADALDTGLVDDAVIAASLAQAEAIWKLRHGLSEAQRPEGGSIKHDISVPVARVPEFIRRASETVTGLIPGCRPVPFGHVGDGNIHFNVSQPSDMDKEDFLARWRDLNAAVHAIVLEMHGSISAEHGIGRLKRDILKSMKSEIEMDLMRRIKKSFDPAGILSPGRVL